MAQWVEFVKFSGAVRVRVEPSLGSRLGCLCLFHNVRDVPFRDEVTSLVLSIHYAVFSVVVMQINKHYIRNAVSM